ncbi:MAG: deoxyribose-phosphate aldolase [Saprospiraceae bacterium]|nr:deoxyribose-phosphate aldolase [Saprospiraceae bacterium]
MDLINYLDHTLLSPTASTDDIKTLCEQAIENQFAAVCVSPYFTSFASKLLNDSAVKLAIAIGYPYGFHPTVSKAAEIKWAIDHGADEIDAVINLSALKSKDYSFVRNDIETMARSVSMRGKSIKLIIEESLLTEEELARICDYCIESEVNFVKNSTGVLGTGANPEIIQRLRSLLPKEIKIKASGGIKNKQDAFALIEAGAERIGSSSCLKLI